MIPADVLHVAWVIWSAGSITGVFVTFVLWSVLQTEQAKGYAFLAWLACLGSMIGAIIVGQG
jgi:hypothetical protein